METKYPILYGAYGANTNFAHMAQRCPTARYVGNMIVEDMALVFRGVADVVPRKGARVYCALWRIMPSDERALDAFEGYPNHYAKMYVDLLHKGKTKDVMLYVMAGNRRDRHEPPKSYESTLRVGYEDCKMPTSQIDDAVLEACESAKRELRYKGKWYREDRNNDEQQQPHDDGGFSWGNSSSWLFDSSVQS